MGALTKELLLFSMLLVSVITLALFIVKIFFYPDFLTEFSIAAAVTVAAAVVLHFISVKIGAYGLLKELDWRNER